MGIIRFFPSFSEDELSLVNMLQALQFGGGV